MGVETLILGRPYRLTLARVKRQKTTVRGKQYWRPAIQVPREDLEWILRGSDEAIAILYLAKASTVNLLSFPEEDQLWTALPPEARTELYYHGQAPQKPRGRVVLIAAEEQEIRELGLDPERPITLDDIVEAVRRRLLEELHREAKGDGKVEVRASPTQA